jgi:hypothetical protein
MRVVCTAQILSITLLIACSSVPNAGSKRHLQHALTFIYATALRYHHMKQASYSRAWLTVAVLAVITTQQRAAAMQPSKPLQYCSHDMSSRGIPSLQASVLQSSGKSASLADDVQVLQTQVQNKRTILLFVPTLSRIDALIVSVGKHCIVDVGCAVTYACCHIVQQSNLRL